MGLHGKTKKSNRAGGGRARNQQLVADLENSPSFQLDEFKKLGLGLEALDPRVRIDTATFAGGEFFQQFYIVGLNGDGKQVRFLLSGINETSESEGSYGLSNDYEELLAEDRENWIISGFESFPEKRQRKLIKKMGEDEAREQFTGVYKIPLDLEDVVFQQLLTEDGKKINNGHGWKIASAGGIEEVSDFQPFDFSAPTAEDNA